MTRDELLANIITSHDIMKPLIIRLIFAEKKYNLLISELDTYTEHELKEMYIWIKGIEEKEYKQLAYCWGLHKEEMWSKFQTFGITGLREQNMLNQATKEIRRLLDHPYRTPVQIERIAKKKAAKRHDL